VYLKPLTRLEDVRIDCAHFPTSALPALCASPHLTRVFFAHPKEAHLPASACTTLFEPGHAACLPALRGLQHLSFGLHREPTQVPQATLQQICQATGLTYLHLHCAPLSNDLSPLSQLRRFHSCLLYVTPDEPQRLTQVHRVPAAHELDPIAALAQLEALSVSASGPLQVAHARSLRRLQSLRMLELVGRRGGDGSVVHSLTRLSALTALKLGFLQRVLPADLLGLTALQELACLEISETPVDCACAAIGSLRDLRYLAVCPHSKAGSLDERSLAELFTLTRLVQLNLCGNVNLTMDSWPRAAQHSAVQHAAGVVAAIHAVPGHAPVRVPHARAAAHVRRSRSVL
jgi:hypothetical protein